MSGDMEDITKKICNGYCGIAPQQTALFLLNFYQVRVSPNINFNEKFAQRSNFRSKLSFQVMKRLCCTKVLNTLIQVW